MEKDDLIFDKEKEIDADVEEKSENTEEQTLRTRRNPSQRSERNRLSKEMKTSFLNYAMSVIVSRAIPDVRDGMKPVHRRILYAMNDLGMHADKPFKIS